MRRRQLMQMLQGVIQVCCWVCRRLGGRRLVGLLAAGATLSLMMLVFTPYPPQPFQGQPPLSLRRIHQKDDDYTAPKANGASDHQAALNDSNLLAADQPHIVPVPPPLRSSPLLLGGLPQVRENIPTNLIPYNIPLLAHPQLSQDADTGQGHVEEVKPAHQNQDNLNQNSGPKSHFDPQDLLDLSQKTLEVSKNAKEVHQYVNKAQESALNALQHGYKLTAGQKKLIERLSPAERKTMEARTLKARLMQDRAYIQQLRIKKQIEPLPGGGEKLVSTSKVQVRFPAILKKIKPEDWEPPYEIFHNITYYPWVKNAACSNYSISFAPPSSLPTRALASFPSSGNTWVRYLVEGATGLFTGSMYDDSSLTRRGMYGEGICYDSGMTILQKSHGYTTESAMKLPHEERVKHNHMDELSHQGVLVIRNPFKALISHRHLDVGGHTGYAPKAHFVGKGWDEFVTLKIMLWKEFYIDWLTVGDPKDIHITFYENLKIDPIQEMSKIMQYLKLPSDNKRLQCVSQNTDGLFKRKPPKNAPLDSNPFTRELKDLIYKAIDDVNSVLIQKGKEELPLNLYELYDTQEAVVSRSTQNRTVNNGSL